MKKYNLYSIVFICVTFLFSFFIAKAQVHKQPSVKIEGEVTKSLTLYQDDFNKLKRTELDFKDFKGLEYHYAGVALFELLELAGATANEIQGDDLAKYLLVKSSDGSEVVLSLAELDSSLTDNIVIIADQMNGKPLPQGTGPFRLVVPGDKKRTRWIWEVNTIVIRYAKE